MDLPDDVTSDALGGVSKIPSSRRSPGSQTKELIEGPLQLQDRGVKLCHWILLGRKTIYLCEPSRLPFSLTGGTSPGLSSHPYLSTSTPTDPRTPVTPDVGPLSNPENCPTPLGLLKVSQKFIVIFRRTRQV